jgi:cation diffusion facilitator CzcD-associated flavoprotein CzcO
MFVDARSVPDGSVVETEVCIIGAGAAGITIARELRDRHRPDTDAFQCLEQAANAPETAR